MNTNPSKNSESQIKSTRPKSLLLKSSLLNEHFQCGICQGYIIDATTIIDCLHSFCKSCIVHFLKTIDPRCPTCNCSLKDHLGECLRPDASLQRLIYKLVPNLLDSEIERRDRFYLSENLSTDLIINTRTLLNVQLASLPRPGDHHHHDLQRFEKENQTRLVDTPAKYIQCVAQTPVGILAKLLRNKYDIPAAFKVKLTYQGHRLDDAESLMHVFTSFLLSQDELIQINYEIKKKKQLLRTRKNSVVTVRANQAVSSVKTALSSCKENELSDSRPKSGGSSCTKTNYAGSSGVSGAKKPIFSAKKLNLVQNDSNLMSRYRPIRKKEDPREQASSVVASKTSKGKKFVFLSLFLNY